VGIGGGGCCIGIGDQRAGLGLIQVGPKGQLRLEPALGPPK
jgi:hypothetical protein